MYSLLKVQNWEFYFIRKLWVEISRFNVAEGMAAFLLRGGGTNKFDGKRNTLNQITSFSSLHFPALNKFKKCFLSWKDCGQIKKPGTVEVEIAKFACLKWQCHEIFWHFLFHYANPSGPLINRFKWFLLNIRFLRRYSNF